MKIVFVSRITPAATFSDLFTKPCSGTVYSYLTLANELAALKHQVYVLSSTKTCVDNQIHFIKANDKASQEQWLLTQSDIDAIIGISYAADIFKNQHITASLKIFWWHNTYTSNFEELTTLLLNNNIDLFVGISRFQIALNGGYLIKAAFKSRKNILEKIKQIYNPIILPTSIQQLTITEPNNPSFAFVGNPNYDQGFHLVLEAFDTYKKTGGVGNLKVFGGNDLHGGNELFDPEFKTKYIDQLLCQNEVLRKDVIFYGSLNRRMLYAELIKCNGTILGLKGIESFSVSAAESCALNIPVLTRKRGGQTEIIKNNKNGFTIIYNKKNVTKGLKKLAQLKPQKLNRIAKYNTKHLEKFNPKSIALQWEELLHNAKAINNKRNYLHTLRIISIIIWGRIKMLID